MKERTQLKDLDVLNNFLFNAIATDEHVAKPFFRNILSTLLEREIGDITISAQTFLQGDTPNYRGIRMDVKIVEDVNCPAECTVYNVEPQLYKEAYLPKRVRFYQAKKDSKGLHSGEKNWNKLPDLYMIIITNYDPFGEESMIYTFKNTCKEFPDMPYDDGLKIIYFNVYGTRNCKESIKQLLSYLNNSKIENVTNNSIAQLHSCVNDLKQNAEVENRFMTWGEYIDHELEEACAEACAEAREDGRVEELRSTLSDFLQDLGTIPKSLQTKLLELDKDTLKSWIKLAAKAENLEDFLTRIN